MDGVIRNEKGRQTRIWSPQKRRWIVGDFPVPIVTVDAQGNRLDAGVRFGVLDKSGRASLLVRNENAAGLWHFDGERWVNDPQGLASLESVGLQRSGGKRRLTSEPIATSLNGRDRGVRFYDLDRDGICELLVANGKQNAVFAWSQQEHFWRCLPYRFPEGTAIVDAQGRDAGCRLVDLDDDGFLDLVFSNAERYSLHIFAPKTGGWTQAMRSGKRGDPGEIPMIVRGDGSNTGGWFTRGLMCIQNEETGRDVQIAGKPVRIPSDHRPYRRLLGSGG